MEEEGFRKEEKRERVRRDGGGRFSGEEDRDEGEEEEGGRERDRRAGREGGHNSFKQWELDWEQV